MRTKPTPWYPAVRVFSVMNEDVIMLRQMNGIRNTMPITASSLNFAAACGNEIIKKLIRKSRNER